MLTYEQYPKPEYPIRDNRPTCEGVIIPFTFNGGRLTCSNHSVVQVEGKNFCRRHCGQFLSGLLLEGKL